MSFLLKNIESIKQNLRLAAKRADRDLSEIALIAITKTRPVHLIRQAVEIGIKHIGENRVQEFQKKSPLLNDLPVTRHLVGHLQTNKVKYALELFDCIHSVDSLRLAEAISRHAEKIGREEVRILIQVNTSGEASKFGVEPDRAEELVRCVSRLPGLHIFGLMTIGAFVIDPEIVRPMFSRLRQLRNHISGLGLPRVDMTHLSMGMTNDYMVAVEEGATLVRIGTAIFGQRR
ncbi:MAG: YggS family pyridoxal phosphate enzyme [Candidatus Cloacimonetes bacterium 4572_55]|nr:MAG: YggS family pyridoxal phosphate enzyme [Candidatus Cloacimonetes bacterium 4572_55]